tara:strand:+ start:538 stop:687 length:150 start_codon:yes stop_codon:yes gene_type:complete
MLPICYSEISHIKQYFDLAPNLVPVGMFEIQGKFIFTDVFFGKKKVVDY